MNIKILCCALFCFYAISLNAKNYSYYYRQVQLAEEDLLNENLQDALKHYDTAFINYDFKFVRDCFIAAQTAAVVGKNDLAYRYLSYCIEGGVKFNCLFISHTFDNFQKTNYYIKLKDHSASLWNKYLAKIDKSLNLELTRRFEEEQKAKQKGGELYYRTIDDNVFWIEHLLNNNKYPGEKVLGTKSSLKISTVSKLFPDDTCEFSSDMANVSLRHFKYGYDLLRDKLIAAMNEGQINPKEVVLIFIFSKYRICNYRKGMPQYVKNSIENFPEKDLVFNLPFEKSKTDIITANKNRFEWYIPRIGGKLDAERLLKKYGIVTMIGDWIGD